MKHYTESIPVELAKKLKEKGMPMTLWQQGGYDFIEVLEKRQEIFDDSTYEVAVRYEVPLYCEVFDWLMEKSLSCEITRYIDFGHEEVCSEWDWNIEKVGPLTDAPGGYANTWHEAAEKAIEKALELI